MRSAETFLSRDLHFEASRLVAGVAKALDRDHRAAPGAAETLARLGEQNVSMTALRAPEPRRLAACRHLPETTAHAMMLSPNVAAALAAIEEALHWKQNPNYAGDPAMADYAYCEIIGPDGFFAGDDFLLGLMILGPERLYRDHLHKAPELYWLLTGPSEWSHDRGPFKVHEAGDMLWHPANLVHAVRTRRTPLLALWAWTRDVGEPARYAAPGMGA